MRLVASHKLSDVPTTFRPCAPDQSLLFPPSPRDWFPEGHLAFFIADRVATLDLEAFYGTYQGGWATQSTLRPTDEVTVLLCAYPLPKWSYLSTFVRDNTSQRLEQLALLEEWP